MSEEIQNAGRKGYCMMWFFILFFLFISTWAYVYYSNSRLDFTF